MHPRRRTFRLVFTRFPDHTIQGAEQGTHLCGMQVAGGSEVCLHNSQNCRTNELLERHTAQSFA